jgi:hypothetical protein
MSTYLFVLAAGELERLSGDADGVAVGVVTTAGKSANGRFALDEAIALLKYYNDYFGQKYPLPKLDLIAVPGGFGGAMENWGGITFFESRLLFDPAVSSAETRRASVVWRSRHDGVVGQPLAQRGICQLDAEQGGGRAASRMAYLAQRQRRQAGRNGCRRAPHHASDPAADR